MKEMLQENNKKNLIFMGIMIGIGILAVVVTLFAPEWAAQIGRNKEKQVIMEAKQVMNIAQTLLDEVYEQESKKETITVGTEDTKDITYSQILELAKVKGEILNINLSGGMIETITYRSPNGRRCTYKSDKITFP